MALMHSWAGLLPSWLVFVIFLFGTTAFFQNEISRWMRPELVDSAVSHQAIAAADKILRDRGAKATSWNLSFPSARGGQGLEVSWRAPGMRRRGAPVVVLDPQTGQEVSVRETRGGFFLYRFHFDLHYMPVQWARIIVSLAAAAMLVALISGIVTHKKIFADFFLLRFGKGQRSWLDAHNVSGVLAAPFFVMITYTGLVTLMFTLMPWAIAAHYPDEDAFYAEAFPEREVEPSGVQATVAPLSSLARAAALGRDGLGVSYISVDNVGDAAAVASVYPAREAWSDPSAVVTLNAVNGSPTGDTTDIRWVEKTRDVMVDLHRGWFAAPVLRWLYFLSGAAGTVMIATGLVLWTAKRRARLPNPDKPYLGFWLVERLNIAVIVGAPLGIAAYFLANRLLPADLPSRAASEINILFAAWGAVLAWTLIRPARRAWIESLWLCAAAYLLVPVVSAFTTDRGFVRSLLDKDWAFASFDATMIAVAGLCALAARKASKHKPMERRRPVKSPREVAA
jgi:uncharacterized iron-regulated membrane protein